MANLLEPSALTVAGPCRNYTGFPKTPDVPLYDTLERTSITLPSCEVPDFSKTSVVGLSPLRHLRAILGSSFFRYEAMRMTRVLTALLPIVVIALLSAPST